MLICDDLMYESSVIVDSFDQIAAAGQLTLCCIVSGA